MRREAIDSALFTSVVSIVATKRRRFLWAAWWTAPPVAVPFRKPDAFSGGARTREEARKAAARAAGRPLVEIDARWARAWARVLVGQAPWSARKASPVGRPPPAPPREGSKSWALALLGLDSAATADDVKRAFRAVALRAHPDRGGTDAEFIRVKRAHDVALGAVDRRPRRRR
jgi:hypothetical protein